MANSTNNIYTVNTPPYETERHQGALWSIMLRQYRFSAWEAVADTDIECGVFLTLVKDALGYYRAKQLSAATDKIFGVNYLNQQRSMVWDEVLKAYKVMANKQVSLIEEGDIFMYAEAGVDIGDPVFTRWGVDTGLTRIGALNKAAGTGLLAVPGAKFLKASTSPGVVPISLPDII